MTETIHTLPLCAHTANTNAHLVRSGVLPAKALDLGDWQEPRKGLSGTGLSSGVAGESPPGLDGQEGVGDWGSGLSTAERYWRQ